MKKGKGKGKRKGKGKGKEKFAAIDEKSDIKQIEEANSSGIEKNKEEVFSDGGQSMTSEVQHIEETSHCVQLLYDEKSDIKQIEEVNSSGIEKKEEVFCDGGQSMTSEVQHIGETSHCVERKPKFIYLVYKKNAQHGAYKGSILGVTASNDHLGDQKIDCSIIDASDTNSAQHQKCMPNMLGDGAVKVYFVDECSVVVDEIKLDFKYWYSSKYNNFRGKSNDDWLKYIEFDLKELFGGILKLLAKLSPDFPHGNWMGSIPIFYEGKLYSMKYDGYEGYLRDIKNLHQMIENVLMRLPPEAFDALDDSYGKWGVHCKDLKHLYKGSRFKEFTNFMLDLKNFNEQKKQVLLYRPFFWSQKERLGFMEKVYDIFWVEKNLLLKDVKDKLDLCFPLNWFWWKLVPVKGPFRRVFEYKKEGESQGRYKRSVDSIPFWRNSKCHYNDNIDKFESPKTIEEIEAELNEKFEVCSHVFTAICNFIGQASNVAAYRTLRQRLIALGEEMGFFPINANAITASASTPNSNTY